MVLFKEPRTIFPLARKRRAYPVGEWRRNDAYRLGGLGLLSDYEQHFRAPPFSRRAKLFDLTDRNWVQIEVRCQSAYISWLFADDLRACVLENAGTMHPRLRLGT